jgi:Tfp pilus tip-associated adhesin PilY1
MRNPEQYIWGQNLTNSDADTANPDVTTADLFRLPYTISDPTIEPPYSDPGSGGSIDATGSAHKGWALRLMPAQPLHDLEAEYVTTSPFLYQGVIYVSTFVPKVRPDDQTNIDQCAEFGYGKLYAFNPFTGAGMWPGDQQSIAMRGIKISGISAHRGRLYLSFEATPGAALHSQFRQLGPGVASGEALNPMEGQSTPEEEGIPFIQYWKEVF